MRKHSSTGGGDTPSFGDLITPEQAAAITGHPTGTLASYRSARRRGVDYGPPFFRIGGAVFYRLSDVEAYVASREVG